MKRQAVARVRLISRRITGTIHARLTSPSAGSLALWPQRLSIRSNVRPREKALRDPYKRAPNKAMYWPKPSPYVQQRLDETRSWLLTHSSELPSELEDDQGRIKDGRTYFEQSEPSEDVADWDGEGSEVSKYESHGRFPRAQAGLC